VFQDLRIETLGESGAELKSIIQNPGGELRSRFSPSPLVGPSWERVGEEEAQLYSTPNIAQQQVFASL
jgi:hypothetical protein